MPQQRDLNGRVVAVIGATGGLGSALVTALRSRGTQVIEVSRAGHADISADVHADLRDAGAGDALVEYATATHGRLDGVVVAAGIVAFGDLADTSDIAVEELLLTNTMGPIWLAKRVEPLLADSAGFFVNISGVVAETPMPGMVAYSASKAAAAASMSALAKEWRRRKILVVDARPPHTETGLASRPLEGTAPSMPDGLSPESVAERIVDAIVAGEREISGSDFGGSDTASADRSAHR